ncbi:MAG: DUF4876 domain-containing protein [Prevotellaceae bacterium]|jgi:hypothetical protein|nr:DUF4876 domain-containing protein [Prevotellaceae bacterium]
MRQFNFKSRIRPALWTATAAFLLATAACTDNDNNNKEEEVIKTFKLNVKLEYPDGYAPQRDVNVRLRRSNADDVNEAKTDSAGVAVFTVIAGIYEATAAETRSVNGYLSILNGVKSSIEVTDAYKNGDTISVSVPLTASKTSQLVIKELYIGGCENTNSDNSVTNFYQDKYVILYNNSNAPVSLSNLTLAITVPLLSASKNEADKIDGKLFYESEGWVPAGYGLWTIQNSPSLDPYKQIVIAINCAVDNTKTYSQSINFANPEYYACHDLEVWNDVKNYTVSELIPSEHYLKAYLIGQGSSWPIGQLSPAFFVFIPEGITPEAIAAETSYSNYYNNNTQSAAQHRKKIPTEWVLDAIEVFKSGEQNSNKRLTPAVDAGSVKLTNAKGYTLYRNVDKAATEAIAENAGKLVYSYSLGTADIENGSTDPSGIDAEASLKNGAKIIYKDTNNSTNDFHQRAKASLRD